MTRPPFFPLRRGHIAARVFSISHARRNAAPLPARKPVGAFRGGLFGFLTGAVVAGASVYWYILGNYRIANEMLSDDITSYVRELEGKVDRLHKKK
ncbi:hypothetical protein N7510_006180 [Penicillium lagena]|uniref:uncharacterized protein n=1 Tax=Penicillium lagena TaxID=94218 RepID=UPI0025417B2C|nr:uncharacterized protein N7510_006180 [Penicillium lagena]KAJ5612986.1 hypothetical protein N7510_006180 [Penicillium lagena]